MYSCAVPRPRNIVNKVEKVQIVLFQSAGHRPADAESASLFTMKYKQRPRMRPSAAKIRRRVQKDLLILLNLLDYKFFMRV